MKDQKEKGHSIKTDFRGLLERDGKFVYKNKGTSMYPLIREGRDLLVIEKIREKPKKYDVLLYQRDQGEYVLHRVLEVRPDGYVLNGDNCWWKEYGITDRHIIGILTAVIRDGKELSTGSWQYRLYTRLWCGFFPVRAALLKGKTLPVRIRRKLLSGRNRPSG